MPQFVDVEELAEEIADLLGLYRTHEDLEAAPCRGCFTMDMARRIRSAVETERMIERQARRRERRKTAGRAGKI